MDINVLIPAFMVISVAGSSLSIAAYSAFNERTNDKKLLLIIASFFAFAFLVVLILSFLTLENLSFYQYIFSLTFYALIFLAVLSIIGFILHRLQFERNTQHDELIEAIDIIKINKDGLYSSISLFESEASQEAKKIDESN